MFAARGTNPASTNSVPTPITPTFTVNSTADVPDSNVGDGHCDTDGNPGNGDQCSLRAAIQEGGAAGSGYTINFNLPVNSTITLNSSLPAFVGNITIVGPGSSLLRIQRNTAAGTSNFSLFSFFPINGNFNDSISGVTLANGINTDPVGQSATSGLGGCIINFTPDVVTISDVVIQGCTAKNGGAIFNSGSMTLTNTTVSGNTAGNGGGIYNTGSLTVTSSTMSENAASGGEGGGIFNRSGTLSLSTSTVSGNTCDAQGGGISSIGSSSAVTLTNSTVSGNKSTGLLTGGIGGIFNGPGGNTLNLTNATVTANTTSGAATAGSVAGISNASGSTANIGNSIVAKNVGVAFQDLLGNFTSQGYNLVGGGNGFTNGVNGDQVGVDPLLGPLADNGGATKTHALLVGSPAIDAGNTSLTTDQRGQTRPIDDPNVTNAAGGNASDIGAFETNTFQVNTLVDADDGACTALGTGNGCTLREAINAANAATFAEVSFASALTSGGPATISLSTALPSISSNVIVEGPGANLLTVMRSSAGGTPDFRIFHIDSGAIATLSDLTISNGSVVPTPTVSPGGDFLNLGSLTITKCVVRDALNGGGIFNLGGVLVVNSSTITNNHGASAISSTVPENTSTISPATVKINDSTIAGNSGLGVNNSTFQANADNSATVIINNTTITGNDGGGVRNNVVIGNSNSPASITINNSTISGNHTNSLAGGIQNGVGTGGTALITINNSTISGNSTTSDFAAGAIYSNAVFSGPSPSVARVTVNNCTVFGNSSSGNGSVGGILNSSNPGTIVKLSNTILAGNTGGLGNFSGSADPTSSFNLIGTGGSGGLMNSNNGNQVGVANPLIGPLGNNGGPTMTHALLPGSPAIDAGSNANLPPDTFDLNGNSNTTEPIPFDQRGTGFNRVLNGTVDIGAFESRGFTIAATGGTPQSATITTAFGSPLVATVSSAFGEPVAGGTVTFTAPASGASGTFTGGITTVSVPINGSGVATSPTFTANSAAGNYSVIATAFGVTSPATFSLTNSKATTLTTVGSSVNPSDVGQSVTFTATIANLVGITPTGTVQFMDGANNIGSATCIAGASNTCAVQVSISTLSVGNHNISANYSGDGNFNGSSGTLSGGQTVRPQPSLSINDVSMSEGDSGTKNFTFTASLSAASNLQVKVDFAAGNGTATTADSDYQPNSGTLTFTSGVTSQAITVLVNGDQKFEPDETFFVNLLNPVNATISKAQGTGTILNDDAQGGIINFSQSNYSVGESDGQLIITVNRSGDTSAAATVGYSTSDGGVPCANSNHLASSKCDFTTALGTLSFAGGDASKTFTILINQDYITEADETFNVVLSNLTGGAVFGSVSTATVTINDDVTEPPGNAIDDATNFVRQHYHDFLNREPDQSGLNFWVGNFTQCNGDPQCIEVKRINVSAAFFLSIEFQETGYLVERVYKTAYGDSTGNSTFPSPHTMPVPIVRFNEFLADTQEIGQGVVVGQGNWQKQLDDNKNAFVAEFVQRQRFVNAFQNAQTADQFVDALFANAGFTPSAPDRQAAINAYNSGANLTASRAAALRNVAENSTLTTNEFNRAFVLMQFFGYLRRNPYDPQDTDYTGYDFWLTKLNQFGGNFVNAEMVKAFITSTEYRQRFGP